MSKAHAKAGEAQPKTLAAVSLISGGIAGGVEGELYV